MTSLAARLQQGDCIHLWMRPRADGAVAEMSITLAGRIDALRVDGPTRNPLPVTWQSPASGEVALAWNEDETEVSIAYMFSPATVAREGTRVLWTSAAATVDGRRYQVQFAPRSAG